jgi:hypothetical protein
MHKTTMLFTAALALAVCSLSGRARAENEPLPRGYTYDFDPDDLVGETLATTPPLLKVRKRLPRVTLLRPRASFVTEMLESVEEL